MLHWTFVGYLSLARYYLPALDGLLPVAVIGALVLLAALSWVTWRIFESSARRLQNRGFERVWPHRGVAPVDPDAAQAAAEEVPPLEAGHERIAVREQGAWPES